MKNKKEFHTYFDERLTLGWKTFWEEINTDENQDYRRGFKAGLLCSTLQIKLDLLREDNDVS